MQIGRYVSKPVYQEAVLLTASNADDVARWCGGRISRDYKPTDYEDVYISLAIPGFDGFGSRAEVGDYVIKDPETGQFSRMKDEDFDKLFIFDVTLEV